MTTTPFEIGVSSFADTMANPETGATISSEDRIANLMEEVELADRVGLDVFGIGEHHRPDFAASTPAVLLAAAAMRTKQISELSSHSFAVHVGAVDGKARGATLRVDEASERRSDPAGALRSVVSAASVWHTLRVDVERGREHEQIGLGDRARGHEGLAVVVDERGGGMELDDRAGGLEPGRERAREVLGHAGALELGARRARTRARA